ncbi:MAG: hypothetical protein CMF71_06920 [Magnetovibrio sp.]|nr:hypothetical protein [Magnetovibrio sp.]|tara:strand:- start:3223 stop:3891 length:669 start_codon:yes stop_codon:yes gene_type:complete
MPINLPFLAVKAVPSLFWSSPKPHNLRPQFITLVYLILGLSLFGLGEALLIAAGIGVSPWTVLAQGVSNLSGWSIGLSTFIISTIVLFLWWPLKQLPGIGTILNAIVIAAILEFVLPYLPTPGTNLTRIIQAIAGVLVTGLGGAIYLISNLGPGPRDGLMTGLQQLTNLSIALVRGSIEVSAVIVGWLLGGEVGLGTILFAFFIGPSLSSSLFLLNKLYNQN